MKNNRKELREIESIAEELDAGAEEASKPAPAPEMVAIAEAVANILANQLPVVVKAIGDAAREERRADHKLSAELNAETIKNKEISKALGTERHLAEFSSMLQFVLTNATKIREAAQVLSDLTGDPANEVAADLIKKIL